MIDEVVAHTGASTRHVDAFVDVYVGAPSKSVCLESKLESDTCADFILAAACPPRSTLAREGSDTVLALALSPAHHILALVDF